MPIQNASIRNALALAAMLHFGATPAQAPASQPVPAQGDEAPLSKDAVDNLRAAVEANPGDLEAHKAYLKAFRSADEVKAQYEQWMKQHPRVAAIPQALGDKYGHYSPAARQYWLKAAELQPGDPAIWRTLSVDASIRGDAVREKEYLGKAAAADPQNLELQYEYLRMVQATDEAKAFDDMIALAEKHPQAPATGFALSVAGFNFADVKHRIAAMELQRKFMSSAAQGAAGQQGMMYQMSMGRLVNAYIQSGQYNKAVELSEAMIAAKAQGRTDFNGTLKLATTLADIDARMKAGKAGEARDLLASLPGGQGTQVELVKASVLDATGSTQEAYSALVTLQARRPDSEMKAALERYGHKLGKNAKQVGSEVRALVAASSRPAPGFSLDTYPSGKKVSLDALKGKVVLVSFWYPACGPCRAEMPHIETGIKNIDRSKFTYLGINGVRSQDEFVMPFMQSSGYSFTALAGDGATEKAYGVRAYPSNFIIGRDGKIAYSGFQIGAGSEDTLELMIRSLMD